MSLRRFVDQALEEDLGPGDLTTLSVVPPQTEGRGRIVAKEDVVVAGQSLAAAVFEAVSARLGAHADYTPLVADGEHALRGAPIATLHGSLATILTGERVALNSLMHLSGIATHVAAFVVAAGPGGPRIVDTRKTRPLLRALEKGAVRAGGAHNHRFGLYDGVMIKDNHICAVGSIAQAVASARSRCHHLVRIEVEVERVDQIAEAVHAGADVLLLDNMDDATLTEAVRVARALSDRVLLEASGNMTAERVAAIRDVGVDLVSVGGLIHQARWVDLSLRLEP
jgi:nicotinate-nucleotide pyrophosphorylase (carboxylating)